MANFPALIAQQLTNQASFTAGRLRVQGLATNSDKAPPQWQVETLVEGNFAGLLKVPKQLGTRVAGAKVILSKAYAALIARRPQDDWFERMHGLPKKIDAGIVLTTQVHALDLFNAYRIQRRILQNFVNNAGAGITITNLPALPFTLEELDSLALTLNILPDGSPTINGTLDFIFDDRTVQIVLEGLRAILLAVEPDLPLVETLQFATDVIIKRDGKEQRRSLRATPRQNFDLVYSLDAFDRQFLEVRIFGGQDRVFGMPIWFEPSHLTAPIAIGNTVITVDSTAFADFRVGELAIVFEAADNFEALEIQSFTATTITFTSSFTKSFPVRTRVMPVRNVRVSPSTRGEKYPVNLQRTRLRAVVLDEGVDLSNLAAFPTFNSKALLDDGNAMSTTIEEAFERPVQIIDSETGPFAAFSNQATSRRSHPKTFVTRTRQRLWEARQLLHALRGRAVSFYIPTFFDEFVPTADITTGGTTLNFKNIGFKNFANAQPARNAVRVVLKNGTKVARNIVSAAEIDPATEQITVDAQWGINATVAEIERVEYLEKSRLDTDEPQIKHQGALGDALITFPVRSVLE